MRSGVFLNNVVKKKKINKRRTLIAANFAIVLCFNVRTEKFDDVVVDLAT